MTNRFGAAHILTSGGLIAATLFFLTTTHPGLAFLPAIATVSVMAMARRPVLGFYLVVFLVPFAAFRSVGTPFGEVKIHWLASMGVIAVIGVKAIVTKEFRLNAGTGFSIILAVFFVICVVSILISPFHDRLSKEIFLLVAAGLYMGIALYFVDGPVYRRTLPAVIVACVGTVATLAALGFFFDIPLFAEKVGGSFKRGLGGTSDPNNLALLIIFSLPFTAYWFFNAAGPISKIAAAALIGSALLGMVSTYSRSGLLAMGLTTLGLCFVHRKRINPRNIGLILATVGIAMTAAVIVAPPSYWQRQASLVAAEDLSMKRRASYIIVAWDALTRRPFIGWGLNAFPLLYKESEFAERFVIEGKSKERRAHNTYMEVLVGCGMIGLSVFLFILFQCLRNYARARRIFIEKKDARAAELTSTYMLAFASVLVYLLVFSDVYHKFFLLGAACSRAALNVAENTGVDDVDR